LREPGSNLHPLVLSLEEAGLFFIFEMKGFGAL
jgi:hypothetical protein